MKIINLIEQLTPYVDCEIKFKINNGTELSNILEITEVNLKTKQIIAKINNNTDTIQKDI